MKAWCLFEQSGTFRDAFVKNGIEAYCVDLRDDYGKTDILIDLFYEISHESSKRTIFNNIKKDDIVFAFFSCIRFTEKISLNARCKNSGMLHKSDFDKLLVATTSKSPLPFGL